MSISSMSIRSIIFCFLVVFTTAAARAEGRNDYDLEQEGFTGTWQNVKFKEVQIDKIVIYPRRDGRHTVRVTGFFRGERIDFGYLSGRVFTSRFPAEREQENAGMIIKVRKGYVGGEVFIRFNRRGEIVAHALLTRYSGDGEEEERIYRVERFAQAQNGHTNRDSEDIERDDSEYRSSGNYQYKRRRVAPRRYSERR